MKYGKGKKKTAAKKPVKKPEKKQAPVKKEAHSDEKKKLITDLTALMEGINESGLKFLIRQAEVLIYNMKIEQVNSEIQKLSIDRSKSPRSAIDKNKDRAAMEIIESDNGSSFIFVINKTRKFFTLDEMKKIVKICKSADGEKDACSMLYAWFLNNRGDALYDISIRNAGDPSLVAIYNYVINKYTVKE
ncbi:MAG: hypothetical protein MUC95_04985 [Spirochaetes bacterium]|jgi:hypothetical protein|nr:hypothetical protein [Spirochaetota bacterium]